LRAAGGQPIACYGEKLMLLAFADRSFEWTLLLADVETPILGADILHHFHLMVDLHSRQLVDTETLQRFGDKQNPDGGESGLQISTVHSSSPSATAHRVSDVCNPDGGLPPVKHNMRHVIETTGRPVTAKFRRLDPEKLRDAKKEFFQMEKDGIIQRSKSP